MRVTCARIYAPALFNQPSITKISRRKHACHWEHSDHSEMSEASTHCWNASDGVQLAYHEMGEGRPVILLHGLFSDANMNWIRFGHAERIAAKGFRVIMPDLRAHGQSDKPHGEQFY